MLIKMLAHRKPIVIVLHTSITLLAISLILLVGGCPKGTQHGRSPDVEKEIADLKMAAFRLEVLAQAVATMRDEIADLQQQVASLQVRDSTDGVAFLTPGSTNYAPLKFDLGILTVSLKDVTQYANGSKITLQFGNPLSSAINGFAAHIAYGPVDANGIPQMDLAKSKDASFATPFKPGSWTDEIVILDGMLPDKLGFILVSGAKHAGVSLIRPPEQ